MDNSPSKPRKTERVCKTCRGLKKWKAPDDPTTVEALEAKLSDLAKQLEASNAQLQSLQGSTCENLSPDNPSLSSYDAPIASSSSSTQIADQDEHVIGMWYSYHRHCQWVHIEVPENV
ncbi:hypothetical protein VC83_08674 [Pseudogymnoascus destructans]|uniref:Uncharacterized protein n=1 Tax=Pseudogymnoascus destructans TaxID=655981 RepID=A0A176ZXV6_9PEZI|nr:uncharacterized protein VC83_08674 [Pseudogymnoascus destructans]OAF54855.1 hypothetical protein VC83_08674 [Pseudogymnoascus destructans]